MTKTKLRSRLSLGKQGRIVIPAEFRRELRLCPGDVIVARVEDDRIVLEGLDAVEKRLLSWFAGIPPEVSLVDELLAERREAARRETEETAEWLQAHPRDSS
jgi:AbrB family looped-hinge helix DNA binding protein